jgi:hypothetical protein
MRWWFPKRPNLPQKVPAPLWPEGTAWLVDRRAAPTPETAEKRRAALVAQSPREFPEAGRCLLDEAAASLPHLLVPQRPQHYGRTSTLGERAFVAARRRPTVLPPLWGETSLVNLVFGVLIRVRARWGKKCFRELEQQPIRNLRGQLKLDEQEVSIPAPSEP